MQAFDTTIEGSTKGWVATGDNRSNIQKMLAKLEASKQAKALISQITQGQKNFRESCEGTQESLVHMRKGVESIYGKLHREGLRELHEETWKLDWNSSKVRIRQRQVGTHVYRARDHDEGRLTAIEVDRRQSRKFTRGRVEKTPQKKVENQSNVEDEGRRASLGQGACNAESLLATVPVLRGTVHRGGSD